MNALHPAWYNHKPGEEIGDLSLLDSLTQCFNEIYAIGDLMMSAHKQDLSEQTLDSVALMLTDQAREAESLVEQWHKQHHGNVTQLTTDGDQS